MFMLYTQTEQYSCLDTECPSTDAIHEIFNNGNIFFLVISRSYQYLTLLAYSIERQDEW
jgi:hypothetical protein